ncbi:MAG TPA: hypothetical protein VF770_00650, partial [Solirubrobacterales bacterium]
MSPPRRTFAQPRPRPAPAPSGPRGLAALLGPFAHPVVGTASAAGLFLASAAALVSLTGDPKAGAP